MDIQEETRYQFALAVKECMKEHSLDKITVTKIVEKSHMTRQTFYRYFKDKYDLVNWYFEKLVMQSFRQMGTSLTLHEGLVKKFHFIENDYHFFKAAFSSQDYNSLVKYDFDSIHAFYKNIIVSKTGKPLDKETAFLLEMYCRGSIDMTVNWVKSNMPNTPEEMADLLIAALPPKLEILLTFLDNE